MTCTEHTFIEAFPAPGVVCSTCGLVENGQGPWLAEKVDPWEAGFHHSGNTYDDRPQSLFGTELGTRIADRNTGKTETAEVQQLQRRMKRRHTYTTSDGKSVQMSNLVRDVSNLLEKHGIPKNHIMATLHLYKSLDTMNGRHSFKGSVKQGLLGGCLRIVLRQHNIEYPDTSIMQVMQITRVKYNKAQKVLFELNRNARVPLGLDAFLPRIDLLIRYYGGRLQVDYRMQTYIINLYYAGRYFDLFEHTIPNSAVAALYCFANDHCVLGKDRSHILDVIGIRENTVRKLIRHSLEPQKEVLERTVEIQMQRFKRTLIPADDPTFHAHVQQLAERGQGVCGDAKPETTYMPYTPRTT